MPADYGSSKPMKGPISSSEVMESENVTTVNYGGPKGNQSKKSYQGTGKNRGKMRY